MYSFPDICALTKTLPEINIPHKAYEPCFRHHLKTVIKQNSIATSNLTMTSFVSFFSFFQKVVFQLFHLEDVLRRELLGFQHLMRKHEGWHTDFCQLDVKLKITDYLKSFLVVAYVGVGSFPVQTLQMFSLAVY